MKYVVERNRYNYREVNDFFGKLYKRKYTSTGRCRYKGLPQDQNYMHYPYAQKATVVQNYPNRDHKLVTLDQLKDIIRMKNKIKNNWFIIATHENVDLIQRYFEPLFTTPRRYDVGSAYGVVEGQYSASATCFKYSAVDIPEMTEISTIEFLNIVSSVLNSKDWCIGRCAIELKGDLTPYDNFMEKCNPTNNPVSKPHLGKYLVSEKKDGRWSVKNETDLPIVTINSMFMNNKTKLTGYILKDERFEKTVELLTSVTYGAFTKHTMISEEFTPDSFAILKQTGMFDEWFEPVYEEEAKLPKINGYEGIDNGTCITYGCAILSKSWFINSSNRHIKSMTLNSGVEISTANMQAIRDYIAENN